MALLSARNTADAVFCGSRGGIHSACPFRERQSLKRLFAMGSLPAESVFWSKTEDTEIVDDGVAVG